ncbi:hypothetical protein MMC17_003769 [Xylographa soralifera]|nr:hypothetical protein [Xylographa soralifera]
MATEKEKKKLDAQIKSADMVMAGDILPYTEPQTDPVEQSEDMQQEAIDVATEAMDKFNIEKVLDNMETGLANYC